MSGYFRLVRDVDVSGVSGTGVVAHGAEFPGGRVVLNWIVPNTVNSLGVFDSLADMLAIHGHRGSTHIEWFFHGKGGPHA